MRSSFALLASLFCLLPSPAALAQEPTRQQTVRTADGAEVVVRMTEVGPQPVDNEVFIVENAGIGIRKPTQLNATLTYTWVFGLKIKTPGPADRITIEEVWPSPVAKVYVQVDKPDFTKSSWYQTTEPLDAMPTAAPWLYIDESNLFVFKITLQRPGLQALVAYQPAVIYSNTKRGTVSRAMQAIRQLQAPAKPASGA